MRIDCNRGTGRWKLSGWNRIELGPLAVTREACTPHRITDRLVKDWASLTGYELKEGRLILSLPEEAGRYEFGPAP